MKMLLILVNAVLGAVLLLNLGGLFEAAVPESEHAAQVRSGGNRKKARRNAAPEASGQEASPIEAVVAPADAEALAALIVTNDVFNSERCLAVGGGRVEMTLVGTFQAGGVMGAVIRLKQQERPQINPFMQMLGPPPGMEGNNQGGRGGRGGRGNRGAFRQRFGADANSSQNLAQRLNKQYVKVGETLGNGYMLMSVSRTKATLVRGSDKQELILQDPSKSAAQAAAARPKPLTTNQQLHQAQLMTQQMMMRMMMNGGPPGGPGNNRGGNNNRGGGMGGGMGGGRR